jgi:hypothetical protein
MRRYSALWDCAEKGEFSRTVRELFVIVEEVHDSELLYSILIGGLSAYVLLQEKVSNTYRIITYRLTQES